jgi:hypothetical protein
MLYQTSEAKMSNDKEVKKTGDQSNDSRDNKLDRTSKKTADEAVSDAPQAKRHGHNFESFDPAEVAAHLGK